MDYEQLATTAVINAVSKTSRLKAFVNSGDKEPSFDGNIYIYNNDQYSKDNIKRVSVQVKGKGVSTRAGAKETIKYRVTVVDLNNYMKNGGVMFFVVYIDKNTGDTKQIYYASLLPIKIKELLKDKTDDNKPVSLNFSKFPSDTKKITDLFLNFYSNAQKQISFIDKDIPSVEELQKKDVLESLSFSYLTTTGKQEITSYPKILDGKELYLYANIRGGVAPVPIKYFSEISQLHMSCEEEITVKVNGTVYYTSLNKTITAEKIVYRIGSSVTISFPNLDGPLDDNANFSVKVTIKLKGTLKQRICALKFLVAMFAAKEFELGGIKFPVDFPKEELKKLHADDYPEILTTYNRVLAVLEKIHIHKDLPLDNFTKEDFWKLNSLKEAIESEKPIRNVSGNLPSIVTLDFGGLHLIMLCHKQDEGTYKLWDYFDKKIDVCVWSDNKEAYPVSQYSIMKEEDFLTVDNLYLPNVIEDFKRIEPQQFIAEKGNLIMLEMLKAYDKNERADLFEAVKQIFSWLKTVRQYLSDEVMLINSLQIISRERDLTFNEKQELYKLISLTDSLAYKTGAFLLLNEQDEAEQLLKEMTKEEKIEFASYPIYKFYTKSKEDDKNG